MRDINFIILLVFLVFSVGQTNAQLIDIGSDQTVCKDDELGYLILFSGICDELVFSNYQWTVIGGTFLNNPQNGTFARVRWTSTGTKRLTVSADWTLNNNGGTGICPPSGSGRTSDQLNVSFRQAPPVSLTTSLNGIYCSNESITLGCNNYSSAFFKDWQYSTSPTSGYVTFRTTTSSSTSFNFNSELPSSLLERVIYFRVRLRP